MNLDPDFEHLTVRATAMKHVCTWQWKKRSYSPVQTRERTFCYAVGGDAAKLNGYSQTVFDDVLGQSFSIGPRTMDRAVEVFARWVVQRVKQAGVDHPVFVAMPNRDALVGAASFRNSMIVKLVAEEFGSRATAFDGLRFNSFVHKMKGLTHRRWTELEDNMALVGQLPEGEPILIDDVYSYGNHLTAAWATMPELRKPKLAFFAGRSIPDPQAWVFGEEVFDHICF